MARTPKEVLQAGFCSKSMHKDATDETVSCNRNKANVSTEDIFLFLWENAADTVAALSDHCMFDTWNKNDWIVDILYSYIKNKLSISDIESPSNKHGKRDL